MAWIFSMWIETENKHQEKIIKSFFEDKIVSINGKNYNILTYEGGVITVDGISCVGICSKSDADEMTSIGFEFYKLLQNAPPIYRYALTGIEVDGWRLMNEIEEQPNEILINAGFVIRKDIYKKINSPGKMMEFNSEYLWIPYKGEKWNTEG